MRIETERMVLRDPFASDAKDLSSLGSNLNITRNLAVVPYPYSLKLAKSWIATCQKNAKAKPRTHFDLAIEWKAEKRLIGFIGLSLKGEVGELGYWIGEPYWGKGILSEAIPAYLDTLFKKTKMRRVDAYVFPHNKASAHLLEKFGFVHEGTKRKATRCAATGKIHDDMIFGLLKEDWLKRGRKKSK